MAPQPTRQRFATGKPTATTGRILTPFALAFCFWASPAGAEEIPEHFTPVRAIGMGGAFTAVANDQGAVWTNPAGVARVRKAHSRDTFHLTKLPHLIVGRNKEGGAFYDGYQSSTKKSVKEIAKNMDSVGDNPFWARAGAFPVTLFDASRGYPMAAGVFANTTAKAVIDDGSDKARLEAISDTGGVFSFAYTSDSNLVTWGLSLRPTFRYAYENKLSDFKNLQTSLVEDSNKSQGLGIDTGFLYTFADFLFPTIGVSFLNLPTGCKKDYLNPFAEKRETVCGNRFRGSIGNDEALSVVDPTDVRVGLSITPRLTRKTNLRFALDLHHLPIETGNRVYGLSGIEPSKLLHGGVELFFGNPLLLPPTSFRAGYSQGFFTAGASLNVPFFSVEFATYGRDVSSDESPKPDRRYLASISSDF